MFCDPCPDAMTAPVPATWCEATISAAPRLSICSGRVACRSKLCQTPSGAIAANGTTSTATTPAARAPGVRERQRHEYARPELRRDAEPEQRVADPQPSREQCG